jgi:hypothetical protein
MITFKKLLLESEYENDIDSAAEEISKILKSELESKIPVEESNLNEAIDPLSIVSYVLASTTLLNIISKWAMKIFSKYDFGQGVAAAEKIYNFTHHLEDDFQAPIRRVVGLFTKDPDAIKKTSGILFAIFLLFLGAKAGTEALEAVKNTKLPASAMSTLKAALKGKDVTTVIKSVKNVA